jgi:hypothetical protein
MKLREERGAKIPSAAKIKKQRTVVALFLFSCTATSNLHQSRNTTKSPFITITRHNYYPFQQESKQQTKSKETNRESDEGNNKAKKKEQ